jgi:hypothetical protein
LKPDEGLSHTASLVCSDTFMELHLCEEAWTVKQETVVKSLKKWVGYIIPLMIMMNYCLKKVKVQTITEVIMSVRVSDEDVMGFYGQ